MENLIEITGWEIYKNALNESRKADDRFEDACEYGGYPPRRPGRIYKISRLPIMIKKPPPEIRQSRKSSPE